LILEQRSETVKFKVYDPTTESLTLQIKGARCRTVLDELTSPLPHLEIFLCEDYSSDDFQYVVGVNR